MSNADIIVPIQDPKEVIRLRAWRTDPRNSLGPSATDYVVRKDVGKPEFRAALIRVGKAHLVHIPSWLKALERYRVQK